MARLTSEQRLRELYRALVQAAAQLEDVRVEVRRQVDGSREYWEGNAAETFRNHLGREHRIHHLTVARRRLLEAAALALVAADEAGLRAAAGTGGTPYPPVSA